ncbi:MAG TPA: hypothetical protein VK914_01830 [bacterium]|jgi:hypothetical protein|nr:hypothetical protein [bacterium]
MTHIQRTVILLLAFALSLSATSRLQAGPTTQNPFGVGLELGGGLWPGFLGNVSLSGKYWMNAYRAVDMELGGGSGDVSVGADYLWHNYKVFNNWAVPLYYGVGGYANLGYFAYAGARAKIGVDWLFPRTPWELYVEVVPSLNLINGLGFGTGLDLGGRFYF